MDRMREKGLWKAYKHNSEGFLDRKARDHGAARQRCKVKKAVCFIVACFVLGTRVEHVHALAFIGVIQERRKR